VLKILTAPNPILTATTRKVENIDKSVYKLVKKMEKVLLAQVDPQGVGLAATQVGVGISLFIIKASKNAKTEVFINPKVIKHKAQNTKHEENSMGVRVSGTPTPLRSSSFVGASSAQTKSTGGFDPRSSDHLSERSGWKKRAQDPSKKKKKQPLEGCLSIPSIWSPVVRAEKVVIKYQDLTGSTHKRTFTGLKSVIVQHEMDHLVGVLFTQRALEQNSQLYEEKAGKLKKIDY
jgi:peptide deformylase